MKKGTEDKVKPKTKPAEEEPIVIGDTGEKSNGLRLLAQVTTLSWNLVFPIVGGVLLGEYIDRRTGSNLTWTLSLMTLGIMVAFGNLYNLYMEHGKKKKKSETEEPDNEVTGDQEK
jgi:hypothetical protein